MNDRFKFRVWNNKHNRYIVDSHYPIGSDHSIVIRQDGKAYNLGLGDYEDYSNMHSWAVMEEFTDCILEQCTGLKDKNGNLIYEGDIIKDRGGIIYKIQWKDACFFAVALDNFNYMPDSMLVQTWLNTWKAEIIGNVHTRSEE